MKIYRLEDIEVYREALLLTREIYQLTKIAPLNKDYCLIDQIRRAAISVCTNIAEGYGRKTRKDFGQFLSIALGSTNEVMAILDIITLIYPLIRITIIRDKYVILAKRLNVFRKSLLTTNH